MKYPLKKYQIWIGKYHLGQGYDASTEPEMIAEVVAPSFKVACVLHELRQKLKHIETQMSQDAYVDHQSCEWFYDFSENRNSWLGRYFESKEEAEKTFK